MYPKVSVIIPAYNAEKTLKRCLDSVFASDFLDSMEVILVNDGSTDGTLAVAEEYRKYPNFIVISQPNGGVARARWAGIQASRGEYLGFVDADDYIAPSMFSKMYSKVYETGADMAVCGVNRVLGKYIAENYKYSDIGVESREEGIERIILNKANGYVCNKIYKKRLIIESDYQKTFNITYCEDLLLVFMALTKVENVAYLEESLYFYVDSPDSVTSNLSPKALRDYLYVMETLRKEFAKSEIQRWQRLSARLYARGMVSALRSLVRMERSEETMDLRRDVRHRMKSVKLQEIWKVSSRRLIFDILMVRFGLFHLLYTAWEGVFMSPFRRLWRSRFTRNTVDSKRV